MKKEVFLVILLVLLLSTLSSAQDFSEYVSSERRHLSYEDVLDRFQNRDLTAITGAQTVCIPSNEVCDLIDNDCDGQIDEGLLCGQCIPGDTRPCGCDCANARVLMVLDDNHHGEDLDDWDLNYQNLVSAGVDVTRMDEPTNGLSMSDVSGFDLVWFSNPGWPIDDQQSIDTLRAYLDLGNPVVFQGDDLTWGHQGVNQADLEDFTGLKHINNGQDRNYSVDFNDIDHPLLWQLRGKSFVYKDDDIDTNVIVAPDVVELAHGTRIGNPKFNGSAVTIRESNPDRGVFLQTLLTLSKLEPESTAVTFTSNIVNYLLNKAGKCNCGTDTGTCEFSTQTCSANGEWGACLGVPPVAEICDGLDNNCDGGIDEGLTCECLAGDTRSCGTDEGICVAGQQTCQGGQWGDCIGGQQAMPPDVCDGLDNDCDGFTDESIADIVEGIDTGACQSQITSCVAGVMQLTQPLIDPVAETCDGMDNDCDGEVDEGDVCVTPEPVLDLSIDSTSDCAQNATIYIQNLGVHEEDIATQVTFELLTLEGEEYVQDIEYNHMVGDIGPGMHPQEFFVVPTPAYADAEVGSEIVLLARITNEDTNPQANEGVQVEHVITSCYKRCIPSNEVCDGLDNDCDGLVDEEIAVSCGLTDQGTCSFGTRFCEDGALGRCIGEIIPDVETCNGLDDDCDGLVDEGLVQSCGSDIGVCSAGTQTCNQGIWGQCSDTQGVDETCNGLDDDCDGIVDNGLNCACNDGDTQQCGSDEGVCSSGTQTCVDGQWGSCVGEITGVLEECDGLDNDCDGLVDEALTRECGDSNIGQCSFGTQTCTAGIWGDCQGAIDPVGESCNALDDDCDSKVDESLSLSCGVSDVGACQLGQRTCTLGLFGDCVGNIDPVTEICNGIDDDCNGVVDNIADRVVGSDTGACRPEITSCIGGTTRIVQEGIAPTTEVCDGIDNDCDGLVDEDIDDIVSGSNEGACQQEIRSCVNGAFEIVQHEIGPRRETCDGIDNSCNGLVDEGIAPILSGIDTGICQSEITACVNGQMQQTQPAVLPQLEICDGLDNDCDGFVDEDLDQVTGIDEGVCQTELKQCVGGQWIVAQPGVVPTIETCNGLDDDCDGEIDNGASCFCRDGAQRRCGTSTGTCESGIQTCVGGTWDDCVGEVLGSPEVCDGLDNDCDGLTDENIADILSGTTQGACVGSISRCVDGNFVEIQSASQPTTEVCDGIDNDCDGSVDEDILDLVSGISIGTCQQSIRSCIGGQFTLVTPEIGPVRESCDGLDNDCNGVIDNGIVAQRIGSDVGACEAEVKECVNGAMQTVTPAIGPSLEVCDGIDNDCDGQIDEGIDDILTGSDVGECSAERKRCVSGRFVVIEPAVLPTQEMCDGLDNDCNGQVDESLTQQCGSDIGVCQQGLQTCTAGVWGACVGQVTAGTETCDGLDNDCDGTVDENIVQACGTDIGVCQQGLQTCTNGIFGACEASVNPVAEVCDGLDNNCNGQIDDGLSCSCINGETRSCGSDVGVCSSGTQTCVGGQWGSCVGEIVGSAEVCDALDNDCDGDIDEGLLEHFGSDIGACQQGVRDCVAGIMRVVQDPIESTVETCDGLDNDCDGEVDESLFKSCGTTDVGACELGLQTCTGGVWSSCQGNVDPDFESCDGLDNDCNGFTDDNLADIITGTNVGACTAQVESCVGGVFSVITNAVNPSGEVCDGIDNDCDGIVDEGIADIVTGTDVGACSSRVLRCTTGSMQVLEEGITPVAEVCDGIDNDCNGQVDDGIDCSCLIGESRNCGSDVGACSFGTQNCVDGKWGECQGQVDGSLEICNGIDDDCDGSTDEDIASLINGSDVGSCAAQIISCVDGSMQLTQESIGASIEVCDGFDNDCDGEVDEDIPFEYVGVDEGACTSEARGCIDGSMQLIRAQVGPTIEDCNGIDDDCDGQIDEGLFEQLIGTNVGQCAAGRNECIGGAWTTIQEPVAATTEVCDLIDNDCDGLIDEDIPTISSGNEIGECTATVSACVLGNFSVVEVGQGPVDEICDAKDNDCNGLIDDGIDCSCTAGSSRSCGTSLGACVEGVQSCGADLLWGACVGAIDPAKEVCDGIDNDCDGSVDEGLEAVMNGPSIGRCQPEVFSCVDGNLEKVQDQTFPSIEVCNGVDDDCDGLIDEELGHSENTTSLGECQPEVWECTAGSMSIVQNAIFPGREACDGKDNDCNGIVDDGCPAGPSPRRVSKKAYNPPQPGSPFRGPLSSIPSGPSSSPSVAGPSNAPNIVQAKAPVSLSPNIVQASSPSTRLGIKLIMGPAPTSISPSNPTVSFPAVVKNVGNKPLHDITLASTSSAPQWHGIKLPVIDSLAPGQEQPVEFSLKPIYCDPTLDPGEYRIPITDLEFEFLASQSATVSDSKVIKIPLAVDSLSLMTAPKNYAFDNTMKVCYFLANPTASGKDKLEIEFELHDRKDDLIIDYISPLYVSQNEILLKVKDYPLYNVPRQKPYQLRGFLYENGSIFSPSYLTGEDRSTVDLSNLKQERSYGIFDRMIGVFR